MRFLLDTDHISLLQRQSGREFDNLTRNIGEQPRSEIALSIVSFHEQVLGCNAYINRSRDPVEIVRGYAMFDRLLRTFSTANVLAFDPTAAATFDGLLAQRVMVATMDLRIASIAISRKLVLVTRNLGDFGKVPGLATEDWTT